MSLSAGPIVLWKKRCWPRRRWKALEDNILGKLCFLPPSPPHKCSQNDQRDARIILSPTRWGRPPSPSPTPPTLLARLPAQQPRRRGGGRGVGGAPPPPPTPKSRNCPPTKVLLLKSLTADESEDFGAATQERGIHGSANRGRPDKLRAAEVESRGGGPPSRCSPGRAGPRRTPLSAPRKTRTAPAHRPCSGFVDVQMVPEGRGRRSAGPASRGCSRWCLRMNADAAQGAVAGGHIGARRRTNWACAEAEAEAGAGWVCNFDVMLEFGPST